eukprot:scaffold10163_cov108-Isochrysis_galbana.AAC.4
MQMLQAGGSNWRCGGLHHCAKAHTAPQAHWPSIGECWERCDCCRCCQRGDGHDRSQHEASRRGGGQAKSKLVGVNPDAGEGARRPR